MAMARINNALDFEREPWYKPIRDGPLDKYIQKRDGGINCWPSFKGPEWYEKLWEEGYLLPYKTILRLMWNFGRDDEHFIVTEEGKLQGIHDISAHQGRKGVFGYRRILLTRGPLYETQWLAPHFGQEPKSRGKIQ